MFLQWFLLYIVHLSVHMCVCTQNNLCALAHLFPLLRHIYRMVTNPYTESRALTIRKITAGNFQSCERLTGCIYQMWRSSSSERWRRSNEELHSWAYHEYTVYSTISLQHMYVVVCVCVSVLYFRLVTMDGVDHNLLFLCRMSLSTPF